MLYFCVQSAEAAASSVLFAALSPVFDGHGGLYIDDDGQAVQSNKISCDREMQDLLWKFTTDRLQPFT